MTGLAATREDSRELVFRGAPGARMCRREDVSNSGPSQIRVVVLGHDRRSPIQVVR
jgi:hypothetical protein